MLDRLGADYSFDVSEEQLNGPDMTKFELNITVSGESRNHFCLKKDIKLENICFELSAPSSEGS